MSEIKYSISVGQTYDGKSACIWRTKGVQSEKIARFQNYDAALKFASELGWPLSDDVKRVLAEAQEDGDE